jgi:hypothetical protein
VPGGAAVVELPADPSNRLSRRLQSAGRLALRALGRYERSYWLDRRVRCWRDAIERARPFDAIVANDLSVLPLVLASGVPVVFDAHEHWTSESASWTPVQRVSMRGAHEWLVDDCVPRVAGVMTVSQGIAEDYARRTAVTPAVVTNAPAYHELQPSPVSDPIRLLHVGLADERRRLEDTIEAVGTLGPRFELDMILRWDNAYRQRLEALAARAGNVRILPPVPNRELIPRANEYDVGVFLLPGNFPNQVHVLPNKLFDYIQARLAVAIGPSAEMVRVVQEWDCGVWSSDFSAESFAQALAALTPEAIARMKGNADRAARALNADANRETIIRLVDNALATPR